MVTVELLRKISSAGVRLSSILSSFLVDEFDRERIFIFLGIFLVVSLGGMVDVRSAVCEVILLASCDDESERCLLGGFSSSTCCADR